MSSDLDSTLKDLVSSQVQLQQSAYKAGYHACAQDIARTLTTSLKLRREREDTSSESLYDIVLDLISTCQKRLVNDHT